MNNKTLIASGEGATPKLIQYKVGPPKNSKKSDYKLHMFRGEITPVKPMYFYFRPFIRAPMSPHL